MKTDIFEDMKDYIGCNGSAVSISLTCLTASVRYGKKSNDRYLFNILKNS